MVRQVPETKKPALGKICFFRDFDLLRWTRLLQLYRIEASNPANPVHLREYTG